jgi:hypothetical protein
MAELNALRQEIELLSTLSIRPSLTFVESALYQRSSKRQTVRFENKRPAQRSDLTRDGNGYPKPEYPTGITR